jgi:hypothetical protein
MVQGGLPNLNPNQKTIFMVREDLKISSAELNATGLTREIPFAID